MAKTTLTYLLSLMEAQPEMIHFRITDGSDNVVYDQQNSEFDSEKAINEIKRFLHSILLNVVLFSSIITSSVVPHIK